MYVEVCQLNPSMVFSVPIITHFSVFYLILFFILSLGLTYLLYRKHTGLVNVPKIIVLILSFLRFSSFFLLFLFFLKPEFVKKEKIIEHPLVVFAQDNSSSIVSFSDSLYYKSDYLNYLDSLSSLKDMNIEIITFDQNIGTELNFSGQSTNIASALKHLSYNYANLNVGAYILASDGIYNDGFNPLYSQFNLNAPLYTVLIGDTTMQKDVIVSTVRNNQIVYLDNESPVEVLIETDQMQGANLLFEVFNHTADSRHRYPVYSEKIYINSTSDAHKVQFFISNKEPGLQAYYIRVRSDQHENNLTNNSKYFFIDVLDNQQKILLLFSTPHPDISAIKESLESYGQYQIKTYWCSELNTQNFDYVKNQNYSLIITHQLNDVNKYLKRIKQYKNLPIWHIVGSNTDLSKFNQSQNFLEFKNLDNSFEFANVALNKNFNSFLISDSLADFLSLSTPFLTPFSDYKINNFSNALLYKKIGSLNTERPVMFFVDSNNKTAFLLGEGLWRWRLNDTYLNQNTHLFNTFLSKIVQNLLVDQDKNRFNIKYDAIQSTSRQIFLEAELYNQNLEPVNSYNVDIEFSDSLGQKYQYQFLPVDNHYYLELDLAEGKYHFIAQTQIGDDFFTDKGELVISNFNLELRDLVADYRLLSDLANINNGFVIKKDSLLKFIDTLKGQPDFKARTHLNYSYSPIIQFELLLLIILIILFLEWLIRRRYINY